LGLIASLIPPPRLYWHAAVDMSINLKAFWLKDLSTIAGSELSLNNQDKVKRASSVKCLQCLQSVYTCVSVFLPLDVIG
jgi:hypothetical protein